jgi:ribosomal protein L34E
MQTAENDTASQVATPEPVVEIKKRIPRKIRKMKQQAVRVRWDAVKEQHEEFLEPFYKWSIDKAMEHLEVIRKFTEEAATVMNDRISKDPRKEKCAICGKDLSGTQPNGRPKWIAKKDFKDKNHPEITHSFYYCSELHHNQWVAKQGGWAGNDGRFGENRK